MNKAKKKSNNLTQKVADNVSKIYFALITAFLPLYIDANFYTAMIAAKGKFYWLIAGVMGIGILVTLVTSFVKKEYVLRYRGKLNAMDWALIAYGGAVIISFLLSEDKSVAYFGTGSFYIGTMTLITLIIFYFFVSRSLTGCKDIWDMIIILNVFIFLWIVCNTVSIDILSMHANIKQTQYFNYFACLGQMDSVSAYLCLLLPIIIVFFLNQKKLQFWNTLCLLLGLMAFTGIRTDGVYIGVTVCAIFLIPYALKNMMRFQNLLWLGLIWGIAITFYSICSVVVPERLGTDMGVSGTLIKYWVGAIMIVLCGALLFWIEKKRILVTDKVFRLISRIAVMVLLVVLAVFILDGVISIMQKDGSWGNARGDIWLGAIDLFNAYNPIQKLFGLGTTAIGMDLSNFVGWNNILVVNAHNDFLEYLLSTGIVGLIAYTSTWIVPIVEYVRANKQGKEWSVAKAAYFMALMAYLGQSVVGNPYSLTVPIMYLVFTLFRNEDFHENE